MPKIPTCGHPDRPVFSKGRCKSCANVEYVAKAKEKVRDKNMLSGKKGISSGNNGVFSGNKRRLSVIKVSNGRKHLNAIYKILSAELKPMHPVCKGWGIVAGCTYKATEIHHMRGRRGLLLIMSRHFAYLCHSCHEFCTEHSLEAKRLGLSEQINNMDYKGFTSHEILLMDQYNIKYSDFGNQQLSVL